MRFFRDKNKRVAMMAAGVAASMLGLAYASVPLYSLFCQVTGFGGTPQRAEAAPEASSASDARTITVRFDANKSENLKWTFHAVQTSMSVKIGEQQMAYYRAVNVSDKPVTGSAVFNVTPDNAGIYFNKIQCFCFTEQTLKPGESVEMPVVFFVDPDMLQDPDAENISEITLSYTFYPVDKPQNASTTAAGVQPAGSITN
jgi:cytochrome c oxidase assembly protein subunit 11